MIEKLLADKTTVSRVLCLPHLYIWEHHWPACDTPGVLMEMEMFQPN